MKNDPREPREITVEIDVETQSGGDGFLLVPLVAELTRLMDSIPEADRAKSSLYCGDQCYCVAIQVTRMETAEEADQRFRDSVIYAAGELERERATYERLKAKFEAADAQS